MNGCSGIQQGRPPTRDNIISQASRMYNDSVQTDDRPSTTLTLKSMENWWRLFLCCHPEVSSRLAQHAESVRLDKKLTRDECTTWFNESLNQRSPGLMSPRVQRSPKWGTTHNMCSTKTGQACS